jgi:signal transduction histidine kinase
LLLAALVVPYAVLATVGVRLWNDSRQARPDGRRSAELRRQILARLDAIRRNQPASQPETAFVARVEDGRLVLPWETAAEPPASLKACEQAEFGASGAARAALCYQQAAETAPTAEAAWPRLRWARVLDRTGRTAEALHQFRRLLDTPTTIADEDGIPLRLHAAQRLIQEGQNPAAPLARTTEALRSRPWLAPLACFVASDIAERLARTSAPRAQVDELRRLVEAKVRLSEQAETLQAGFPRSRLAEAVRTRSSAWMLYGAEMWLLGTLPGDSLLAVRSDLLLTPFTARGIRFTDARDPDGELLGTELSGLKAIFPAEARGARELRLSILYFALGLAAAATALGAWFFWRDVRRDLRLADLRSQFVSSVSHELKTPLTAIRMLAETLQMERVPDPATRAEYLDTIVNECERLTRLVDGVLLFSKSEQGKKVFHLRPIQLEPVIHGVVRAMEYPLAQQGFQLNLHIEPGLPTLRADPDALAQALLNLLGNAMKYSGDARWVELAARRQGADVRISVADHGIGIAPAEQARIFEKFYRADTPENRRVPGTGLGLALVHQIARAHSGDVTVESAPGEGSRFTLRLPWEEAP